MPVRLASRLVLAAALSAAPLAGVRLAMAQASEGALSEAEIEELRESAYIPQDRIAAYIKVLDNRLKRIADIVSKPRRPGREEDLHDLVQQFTSISNELNDNLDDYGGRHRDLRKELPKLLQATDRWATAIRSPSDQDVDSVSRALALESIKDLHDDTAQLIEEQKAYFTAHPDAAREDKERIEGKPNRQAAPPSQEAAPPAPRSGLAPSAE